MVDECCTTFGKIDSSVLIVLRPMPVLQIDERKTVSQFQKEFSTLFPFLKIDFYKSMAGQRVGKSNKPALSLSANQLMSRSKASVAIDNSTTVATLKNIIMEKTGLACHVYRKSGTMWIETSLTEDWSLERQNHEAELMSKNSIG